MMPPDALAPFISLGLGGVMGVGVLALLTWVVTKTLPEERRLFLEAMDRGRGEFLAAIDKSDDRFVNALESNSRQVKESSTQMAAEIKDFARAVREIEKRG